MKRTIAAVIVIFLLTVTVHATDGSVDISSELEQFGINELLDKTPDQAQELLEDNGLDKLDLGTLLAMSPSKLLSVMAKYVFHMIEEIKGTLFSVIGIILLCAMLEALKFGGMESATASVFNLVATLCVAAAVSVPITDCITAVAHAIRDSVTFMLSYIPVFAAVITSAGMPLTATAYNMALLGACQFIAQITSTVLVPLMGTYVSLCLVGGISSNEGICRVAGAIKSFATWTLTFLMTIFVGFLTIQSFIATGADTLAVKTTKFLIGSFVPVVGSALSDAFMAAQGCMRLIKTTVGSFGVVVALFTFLPVLARVCVWYLVFFAAEAIGSMLGIKQVATILKALSEVLSVLMAIVLCTALLMIISTGVMLTLGSG